MKRANIFHLRLLTLFGYIGAADWTMWPLLSPGTFVQIDPKQTRVQKGPIQRETGHSQFARPIYFLDIRTGYACGLCEIKNGVLTVIPHPQSGQQTRTFRHPNEAEVVGRVTGVAMGITEKDFTSQQTLLLVHMFLKIKIRLVADCRKPAIEEVS